jgi:polyisoprenoid-binding protein YceI
MKLLKSLLFILITINTLAANYAVNTEHSQLKFSIPYMGFSEVEGRFKKFDVAFEIKDNVLQALSGKIYVTSIDTHDKKRDSHLRKPDFFDSKRYPEFTISSDKKITLVKNKEVTYPVKLTIKTITKEVPLKLTYLGIKKDPWTKNEGHYFKLKGELNRYDFGIKWNKKLDSGDGFVIGDKVKIEIIIEAYHVNEKPAFSRFYKHRGNKGFSVKPEDQVIAKEYVQPTKIESTKARIDKKSEYSSPATVVVTIISGFVIFIFMILVGIYGQKYLSQLLEKMGLPEKWNFIVSSMIIVIVLIEISILSAPYMGWGVSPLMKFFK